MTVVADVDQSVADGTTLNNIAQAFALNPDPNPGNDSDDHDVLISAEAELTIEKTGSTIATAGGSISYEIVVGNNGPSDAVMVVITDTLPGEVRDETATSSDGSCVVGGSQVICTIETLSVGEQIFITIDGRVAPGITGTLTNVVTATGPTATNGPVIADHTTVIDTSADLSLDKRTQDTVVAGEEFVYRLNVTNFGPSVAQNVTVRDTLPSQVEYVGGPACALTGPGVVECTIGTLPVGTTRSVTFTVRANSDVEPGFSIQNTARVESDTPDNNRENDSDQADISVIGRADLELEKTGPVTATAGTLVTYTITISNNGPSTAQFVDIKDTLPVGVTGISAEIERAANSINACAGMICQVGDVAVGETITMTVVGMVDADVADGFILENVATVFSDTFDPSRTNNADEHETVIGTSADLAITKVDLNDPAAPTEGLLYEVVVINNGTSDAQEVVITDTLDANTTFSSAGSGCEHAGGVVTCTVGTLPAGDSATFLIGVTVNDVPTGTVLTNSVTVGSSTVDTDLTNNTDTEETTVEQAFGPTADLGITKTSTPGIRYCG